MNYPELNMGRQNDKQKRAVKGHKLRLQCLSNGVPREEMGENSGQAILEEIIAENFPELKRDIYPQIERALKEFRVWLSTVY